MADYQYDVAILGGGAAGLTVASGAAQFGAKTLLIEKTELLGGDCLHYGCVPSKTLIQSAKVWSLAARASEFGLPGLELPPVDLGAVMDRVKEAIETIQPHDSPERFCELGVEVRFGDASFIDPHTVKLGDETISAKSWVIATGSRPALPPVAGLADTPHWTNETLFKQRTLPKRLLVLGGGPIGLEMAQALGRLGSRVTVVEFLDQILGPEDPDIAALVAERLTEEGVELCTSTKALRARSAGGKVYLTVSSSSDEGGDERELEADALLVATGRRPNIEGLGLENAGVAFTGKGIPADARMRTNVRHIYACGDVNGQLPFTHIAGYEGGIALTNIVLHLPRKADYSKTPWCTYLDPEVASVGLNEKRAKAQGVEYTLLEEHFADNDRAVAEAERRGKLKLLISPKGKVLGCQIVGAHAGELIHEWVAVMAGGVSLSSVAGAIHAYPTLSEISKRAAGSHFSKKLFSDRTRSLLRLLFHLKGRACTFEAATGATPKTDK